MPATPSDPVTPADVAMLGDMVFEEQLRRVEKESGESAYQMVVEADGVLGGDRTLRVAVITAPGGPEAAPEDVWSDAVDLAVLPLAPDGRIDARVAWAQAVTAERKLLPPQVRERYRLGMRGFAGEPDALPMLLAARLRMATLALEGATPTRRGHHVVQEEGRAVARAWVEIERPDQTWPVVVELFSHDADDPVTAALARWATETPSGD